LTHHFFFPFFLNFKTSFFVLLYFKSLTTLCTAMDRNILATRVFVWIFYVQRCFDSTQTILYVHSRWYIIDIKIFFLHVYRAFFVCCGKTKDVYLTSKTINLPREKTSITRIVITNNSSKFVFQNCFIAFVSKI
jgi:hypothetical protein